MVPMNERNMTAAVDVATGRSNMRLPSSKEAAVHALDRNNPQSEQIGIDLSCICGSMISMCHTVFDSVALDVADSLLLLLEPGDTGRFALAPQALTPCLAFVI